MGRSIAVRRLFRHQLASPARRSRRPGAAPGARRAIRRHPREGRDRACASIPTRAASAPGISIIAFRSRRSPMRRSSPPAGKRSPGLLPTSRQLEAGLRPRRASARASSQRGLAEAAREPAVAAALAAALEHFAGRPGNPAGFRRLHRLLEAQSYRVAYWRVAADEINYRRFFNINDLAALRMELPELFEETHRLIFDLVAARRGAGAAHRPHRRAVRPASILRAPAAAVMRAALRHRREDPGALRDIAGLAGRRHHRLRFRQSGAGDLRRSRRRGRR